MCLCIPLRKSGVIERSGKINSKLLIAVNLKEKGGGENESSTYKEREEFHFLPYSVLY